ncbi:hypothetical protein T440DRAFT_41307 [Plenodomus tracheiphilus IPT5]|uniref:Fido domain-containing protein n=1 Tax=Plenodomus tracheiphilus IPT5 TaxID=1408161 RepID=A0A6A7BAA0_9PLEO|nr:hypothetical protein T440DRAFT_41307 [Plenodomus tracheiphilus IPT5]
MRNVLVALKTTMSRQYLAKPLDSKPLLQDVKTLSRILLRDTPLAHSGRYRTLPIQLHSSLDTICPYPAEIPANMERWAKWAMKCEKEKTIHPLCRAVWAMMYFLSVHPFPDGNGDLHGSCVESSLRKTGCSQLFAILVFPESNTSYKIRRARAGDPEEWCSEVVNAEIAALACAK